MIEIRGLGKTYGDGKRALAGVDLDIGEGMLGLLGPNGAGKTTFLSLLVLAREPSCGTMRHGPLDAARARDRVEIRRQLGYLPQDFAPIGQLTGLEYLLHCARLRMAGSRRALRRRAEEMLEAVDLLAAARRRTSEYSGGMRRRLGVAQALLHAPRLLVVDEPTAGLDPEERIRFRNLITDVADATAVLLSTHLVEDIEATCPRVVVIAGGRLRFDGAPSTLLRAAAGRTWELPADASVPPAARLVGRRVRDGVPKLIAYCATPVADAVAREPTLEEAYSAFLALHGLTTGEEHAA